MTQRGKRVRTSIGMIVALAGLLLAGPALSAAGAKPPAHLYTVAVDVDTQGHVVGTKPAADTPAPIAALLEQALKQWRFTPAMQDGHAAAVHSYVVAKVQASPAGAGKFSVQVSYIGVGPKYERPSTGKGPDYPHEVLQALVESDRSHHGAVIDIGLAQPLEGKLATTDAHVTTHAKLTMREKLQLIAAVKRYVSQGSVRPERVNGQTVAATLQTSMVLSLRPALNPDQTAADQATTSAAAAQDASQSQSVLKPSMVDTVAFQP